MNLFSQALPETLRSTLRTVLRTASVPVSVAALLLCLLGFGQPGHADPGDVTITTDTSINYALPNFLFVRNSATVSLVSGASVAGNVEANGGTTVNLSGASLAHDLVAGGAKINLSGGTIGGRLFAFNGATVTQSGGSIGDYLQIDDTSTATLSGGSIHGHIELLGPNSTLNVYGTGLSLVPPSPGQPDYTLTGTLDDGTVISTPVHLAGAAPTQVHLFNRDPFPGLLAQVQALADNGTLGKGNANALLVKLNTARSAAAAGDTAGERDALTAFLNQLNAFVRTGKLTAAQGTALASAAQAILDSLG